MQALEIYGHMPDNKHNSIEGEFVRFVDKSHNADATRRRKYDRLEARVSAEEKALLKLAADLQGCSPTEFVVRSAYDAARKAIKEHKLMSLTARKKLKRVNIEVKDDDRLKELADKHDTTPIKILTIILVEGS